MLKNVGCATFGRFFHKIIWSPCLTRIGPWPLFRTWMGPPALRIDAHLGDVGGHLLEERVLLCVPLLVGHLGVDVMITIFGDFWNFSAIKLAFFSKTNVMIKFLHNLALFWVKTPIFCHFLRKYLKINLKNLAKIFKNSLHTSDTCATEPSRCWQRWSQWHICEAIESEIAGIPSR
jgi:hypothetical protein